MTPPASILTPDRNRASAAAWGTLCLLVVVQVGLVARLAMNRPPVVAPVPVLETPVLPPAAVMAPGPSSLSISKVPEIGQIAVPAPATIPPPLPGSLAPQPAPSISQGPPPIGSFQQPGAPGASAPPRSPLGPLIPAATPVPALPGSSMPVPKMPGSEAPPPLPGSSMPVPKMPGNEAPPPLPGSSMSVPKIPGDEAPPALPGSSMTTPKMPGGDAPPPLPGSSMPIPKIPGGEVPPALRGSSVPMPTMPSDAPPALPGSSMPVPKLPALPPDAASPSASPLPKPQAPKPSAALELLRDVNYVVTAAKEIRGMSDMQGALELLQKADQANPDHPAIIAEIAQTYEQMGINPKATDQWRRIQLLGQTKAGSYFELASRRLGAGPAAAAAPLAMPGSSGLEGEKHLRLGACHVERDFKASSGERYILRVPIVRAGSQPVDGKMVDMEVFFFDRVNGVQVAQSIAQEPVETWQSTPVDWAGAGEETLDVAYHLPALSPAETQQHGRRSYYGYMLRLYYNNKLQDVAAEPRDLLEFGSAPGSSAPAAGGNPLLPPVGR
ncbi:MAG: hypothetical protein ACO1TE_11465 [Prosthecobacter sp.]